MLSSKKHAHFNICALYPLKRGIPIVLKVLHEVEEVEEEDRQLQSATRVTEMTGASQGQLFHRSREGS